MNTNENYQQLFYDSFELFKDDWDNNEDTIKTTISEVASFDFDAAMKMWEYILRVNYSKIVNNPSLTYGLLIYFPEEKYPFIAKEKIIKEAILKVSNHSGGASELIRYFIKKGDFYTANEMLELVSQNKNMSDKKNSSLSLCLYRILDTITSLYESDVDFFEYWINLVDEQKEKTKLNVLLFSKVKNVVRGDDSLLKNASLADLELASSNRELFEIKEICRHICNNKIQDIKLSNLRVNWIKSIFEISNTFNESTFNIIGAYHSLNKLSFDSKYILEEIYKENKTIAQLSNIYNTEFILEKKIENIHDSLEKMNMYWDFVEMKNFAFRIMVVYQKYKNYYNNFIRNREKELSLIGELEVNKLGLKSRINNILRQYNITTIKELVKIIDDGIHFQGLGIKSIEEIIQKLSQMGITISSYYIEEDLKIIAKNLNIKYSISINNDPVKLHQYISELDLKHGYYTWYFGRKKLIDFLEVQYRIATKFYDFSIEESNMCELLMLMKFDENTICLPRKYFFELIDIDDLSTYYY